MMYDQFTPHAAADMPFTPHAVAADMPPAQPAVPESAIAGIKDGSLAITGCGPFRCDCRRRYRWP